ncbi:phosphotransferase [Streptomyces sp. NPDC002769]|uniref:phosphotransferase n=1 Tax=Streptomyces sp. NPDC002769 TaxID=3154542 RepID=UPI003319F2E6
MRRGPRWAAGSGWRRLAAVEPLAGGSKKGVYRLVMDDATTAIAYLWDDAENYWPATEGDDDLTDPFSPGLGLGLFEAAHARLDALGIRVPAIRLVDRDGAHCPADLAIVENLPGESLEELLARDRRAAAPVMARLAESLEAMRPPGTDVRQGGGGRRGRYVAPPRRTLARSRDRPPALHHQPQQLPRPDVPLVPPGPTHQDRTHDHTLASRALTPQPGASGAYGTEP